jgi:hypothetical protein
MTIWMVTLILCVLFEIKHYVCDYPLQHYPYMYENKHMFWHPGGWLHAGIHGIGTLLTLLCGMFFFQISLWLVIVLAITDTLIHHSVDAWKMSKNIRKGWGPKTHHEFWDLLGQDQGLHHLTHYALIAVLFI